MVNIDTSGCERRQYKDAEGKAAVHERESRISEDTGARIHRFGRLVRGAAFDRSELLERALKFPQ